MDSRSVLYRLVGEGEDYAVPQTDEDVAKEAAEGRLDSLDAPENVKTFSDLTACIRENEKFDSFARHSLQFGTADFCYVWRSVKATDMIKFPLVLKLGKRNGEPQPEGLSPVCSVESVFTICENTWKIIKPRKENLAQEGADELFKEFPTAKVRIFAMGSRPNLLWHGLPGKLAPRVAELVSTILSELQRKSTFVHLLVGCSGAGKTRTLFELGSRQFSMFFVGRVEKADPWGSGGSKDICSIVHHLELEFGTNGILDNKMLEACIGASLLARIFVFVKCRELRPNLLPVEWLFFQHQMQFLGIDDIFNLLTVQLLQHCCTKRHQTASTLACLSGALSELRSRLNDIELFYVLDEAHELNKYLQGRFHSREGGASRSMLPTLVQCLQTSYQIGVVVLSGTGTSLLSLVSVPRSKSLKGWDFQIFTEFEGFNTRESMAEYLDTLIDLNDDVKAMIFSLYKGRYRSLAFAVESFLESTDSDSKVFFSAFASKLAIGNGNRCRTYRDDIEKFFLNQDHIGYETIRKFCLTVALAFFYGGTGTLFKTASAYALVEGSLGRFMLLSDNAMHKGSTHDKIDEEDGTIQDFLLFPDLFEFKMEVEAEDIGKEEQLWQIHATIDEPIIQMALWDYLQRKNMLRKYHIETLAGLHPDASAIGTRYELVCAEAIGSFFDGRVLSELLQTVLGGVELPSLYKSKAILLQPEHMASSVIKSVNESYRLTTWVNAVQDRAPCFPTYFHSGPDGTAGPDIIFLLEIDRVIVPVLIQFKSGAVKQAAAFQSLDPRMLFRHNKEKSIRNSDDVEGVAKIQEWCSSNGFVQLLVSTPIEDLQGTLTKLKMPRYHNPYPVAPLLGVIDRKDFLMVFEKELADLMISLKENRKKRQRTTL